MLFYMTRCKNSTLCSRNTSQDNCMNEGPVRFTSLNDSLHEVRRRDDNDAASCVLPATTQPQDIKTTKYTYIHIPMYIISKKKSTHTI